MKMDIVMKLNFDDLEDNVSVESTDQQPILYESDVLNMSGVVYGVMSEYTSMTNGSSPVACNNHSHRMDDDTSVSSSPSSSACVTSPLKKIRALRLFNSPATPKTLLEKCAADSTSGAIRTRSRRSRCRFKNSCPLKESPSSATKKLQALTSNINPFTPTNMILNKKRNTRRELEKNFNSSETPLLANSINHGPAKDDCPIPSVDSSFEEDDLRQVKKLSLHEANVTRYRQEFLEFSLVGKGQYGGVYKCKHRLDGCIYAIKKSLKPIAGSVCERTALNEVYAHAVLGKHPHVVRYYSAWAEESHMLIQNEYCNGGSLANRIKQNHNKESFCEDELRQILLHTANGLKYIHSLQLVHMDIKPENIFIVKEPKLYHQSDESADDGFEEDMQETCRDDEVQYKIGDLGHVTSILNPQVEEGDCRYLPREILREDFSQLQKSDIFALGLTIYEAASGLSLPQNGEEWHFLRDGNMKELTNIGSDFQMLLKMMVHPNPHERPTAAQVVQQLTSNVSSAVSKTHQLLRRQLDAANMKNELLAKQLNEATKCLKTIKNSPTLALNAAIASGVLAGVCGSPIRSRVYNSRTRNTRSGCRRYNNY